MAQNFSEYLKGGKADKGSVFINSCLGAVAYIHAVHFTTRSYARHMALNEFYTGLQDLVDSFAEQYIGLGGSYVIALNTAFSPKDEIDMIEHIAALAGAVDGYDRALQTVLDEVRGLCGQTLYKLKRFA